MRVISQKPIRDAKAKWPKEAAALDRWYRLAKAMSPTDFTALKKTFPAADKVKHYVIFDVGGNKIRLVATVHFNMQRLYVRHVMDHDEYDGWKP
jgi:mRNA interferase HigB